MRFLIIAMLATRLFGATGSVQYLGSTIDSGNISGTNVCANVTDDSYSTYWTTVSVNQYCGFDFGSAVSITSMYITPRTDATGSAGCSASCWARGAWVNVMESSNNGSTWGSAIDTFTQFPDVPQLSRNVRPESATGRYFRVRSPSGNGDVSEMGFIGNAQVGVNARPVIPVVSPFGGVYLSGSIVITLSSPTTSAFIYYTTNGTVPDCTPTGTLYTAPFTLTITGTSPNTLNVIACDSSLSTPSSTVASAFFRNYAWKAGDAWYTVDNGRPQNPYSGGVVGPIAGRYYRTGMWYVTGPAGSSSGSTNEVGYQNGVYMQSSSDLYNWKDEGQILGPAAGATYLFNASRPHIIYNSSTGKYVLWANCIPAGWNATTYRACIATSSTINSGWTWVSTSYQPDGNSFGDDNLFLDSDGVTAYVVYANYVNANLVISQLSSDYLTTNGSSVALHIFGEAPVMFRRGVNYYIAISNETFEGGTAVPVSYITSPTPLISASWSGTIGLFSSNPYTTAQTTSVFVVPGKIDGYVLFLDQWATPINNSTPLVLPLTFSGSFSVQAQTPTSWDLSFFTDSPMPGPSVCSGPCSVFK